MPSLPCFPAHLAQRLQRAALLVWLIMPSWAGAFDVPVASKQQPVPKAAKPNLPEAAAAPRRPAPASADPHAHLQPGQGFKDCDECPPMVVIPPGSFTMGSPSSEVAREQNEVPRHQVQIAHKLAVGKFAVTFDNWQACVDGGGCQSKPNPADQGWGRSSRPVINVSWDDAQAYVAWLKRKTGRVYRLLSEAEWEYAARAGTSTPFYTGNCINTNQANYDGNLDYANCGAKTGTSKEKTLPVGSYDANNFGLFDMAGNVWQWVQDCYHASYVAAPEDGSAWVNGCDMTRRVLRGGSWNSLPRYLRSASRDWDGASNAYDITGFRIARTF